MTLGNVRWMMVIVSAIVCSTGSVPSRAEGTPASQKSLLPQPQCGHHCVMHCCRLLGVPLELKDLYGMMPHKPDEHSMLEMAEVLKKVGLESRGEIATLDILREVPKPVIAHFQGNHFVVVEHYDDSGVAVLDGAGRRTVLLAKAFASLWDGKILRVWRDPGARYLPAHLAHGNDGPHIQFDTLFVDKGELTSVDNSVAFEFSFVNTGASALKILKVRTSCKCLTHEATDEPIMPGQKGSVRLTYRIDKEGGSFDQTAYVHTNDAALPIVALQAAGYANPTVVVTPASLRFGYIKPGKTATARAFIKYRGDLPLEISGAACQTANTTVRCRALKDVPPDELWPGAPAQRPDFRNKYVLELTFTPGDGVEPRVEGEVIVTTNIKGWERIPILFSAKVDHPIASSRAASPVP